MQNTTSTKQGDILRTQESVDEIPNNKSISVHEPIEGTPFYVRKIEDKWFITIGTHAVTTGDETKEDALDKLKSDMWFIILCIASIISDKMIQDTSGISPLKGSHDLRKNEKPE